MEKILLFYKYTYLEYPKQILKWQHALCTRLNLKGRIILAHEGINATLGGKHKALEGYKKAMEKHPLFSEVDYKESTGGSEDFPRLRIVIRDEIVHLGLDPKEITPQNGGQHLSPEQAHQLMKQKPHDLVILDCRNTYETAIGTFEGAICPNIRYFREFPAWVDKNSNLLKDKQVLMDCTGGIRCERASAYVKSKVVAKQVYQLKGGIHRYVEQFPHGFFRGKNYVFDNRIAVKVTDDILGKCYLCKTACDNYTNCINAQCNLHYLSCDACLQTYVNSCSVECQKLIASHQVPKRPYGK
jgi:predicted sulfurtransferase